MYQYIAGRLAQSLIVLLGVSAIVFFALFLTGDPAVLMMPPDASRAEIEAFREAMGFNDPVFVQYGRYLWRVLHGDFGTSLRFQESTIALVLQRLPATALLALTALGWSTLVGAVAGILGALKRGTLIDFAIRLFALLGQAIPVFWLGLLMILVVSLRLGWLPTGGYGSWQQLILPSLSLGAYYMSSMTRLGRASMIDVMSQDYILTARGKGMTEPSVVLKHAYRNALIPVVTVLAMHLGQLLGGAVITELIFSWPGVGRLAIQAIYNRDFPLVQTIVLLSASVFVFVNLLVDILYVILNPRIRYR
jgi:peptide/nickel transport system permease protein